MRLTGLGLLAAASVLASACGPFQDQGSRPGADRRFSSNGERIYFTATSDSGRPITYEGGPAGGGMMHSLACVDCHGPEGHGGTVTMMMQSFEAPSVTWHALTEEEHGEGGHAEGEEVHPPYTEETVKRTITRGLNPAGERLDEVMPRWNMAPEDLDDLVGYLKTLE